MKKYLAALGHIALASLTALVAVLDKPVTWSVALQLAIVVVGSIATYLVPVASGKWAGAFKTGVGVLAAVLAALVPYVTTGGISAQNLLVVAGAILAALSSEIGVNVRKDLALAA